MKREQEEIPRPLHPINRNNGIAQTDAAEPWFSRGSLWIGERTPAAKQHIALSSPSRKAVDNFHAAAVRAGGKDNGAPGVRPDYHANYYAAFVFDPDGNNLEAVTHQVG